MNIEDLKPQEFVLSPEEYEFFIELLERPPEPPSEYSLKALEEYRGMIRNGTLTIVD